MPRALKMGHGYRPHRSPGFGARNRARQKTRSRRRTCFSASPATCVSTIRRWSRFGRRPTAPGSRSRCIPDTAFAPSARLTTRTMTRRRYPFGLTVQFAFHRVISKGIADRYPNLRIAFLEAGCSWVPALVERIEEYSGFPGARAGVDFHRRLHRQALAQGIHRARPDLLRLRGRREAVTFCHRRVRRPMLGIRLGYSPRRPPLRRGRCPSRSETISARRASASCLSITRRAFTGSRGGNLRLS